MKRTSEFGKGCVYCLGLFLAHEYKNIDYNKNIELMGHLWFNAASDHLYEMEIPKEFPYRLKKQIRDLERFALSNGHGIKTDATKEDVLYAINEAKNILFKIDKFLGLKPIKGEYE